MKNFKELRIWQKGMEIAAKTYRLVEGFPKEERYALSSQITRAAVSIPSNIAEGSSRRSDKEYGRFIEISLGSSFELETQVLIANSLDFGNAALRLDILNDLEQQYMMIHSFLSKLKS